MKRKLYAALLFLSFALPFAASAAAEQPTEYVITKGDTMWGLSERFFKDPFYWPNLWAKNPSITNPHFIYPGQKLKFYKDRVEVVPESPAVAGAPPQPEDSAPARGGEAEAIASRTFKIPAGETFIDGSGPRKAGEIVATFENRVMVGAGDYVYTDIGTDRGGKVGDLFSVYRNAGPVSHPVKNNIVGNRIILLGTIKLIEATPSSSRAQVVQSYYEISRDSFLAPERPRTREVPLRESSKELKGYIVAARNMGNLIGEGEIIFLDLGRKQGIAPGNLLYVVREVKPEKTEYFGKKPVLPLRVLGAIVVVETGDEASTALVIKSADAIYPGDVVASPGK